ncbi:MAG: roadblock/LC7 domain-containing protein [Promethearchaeota archaeon]
MSREDVLTKLKSELSEFTNSQSDVQGQILIAYPEGVPIVNTWKGIIDPVLIGALSAAVKLTFRNLCLNLKKGELKRLYIRSEAGRAIIQNAGPTAILTTVIDEEADLGRIAFGMSSMALNIEKNLKNFSIDGVSDL